MPRPDTPVAPRRRPLPPVPLFSPRSSSRDSSRIRGNIMTGTIIVGTSNRSRSPPSFESNPRNPELPSGFYRYAVVEEEDEEGLEEGDGEDLEVKDGEPLALTDAHERNIFEEGPSAEASEVVVEQAEARSSTPTSPPPISGLGITLDPERPSTPAILPSNSLPSTPLNSDGHLPLSQLFWERICLPENEPNTPFEKLRHMCFGTDREIINMQSGSQIMIKLVFDVFALTPELGSRRSDEIQFRVIAMHRGIPIGVCKGSTTAWEPIERRPRDGTLGFGIADNDLNIFNIEVSRDYARSGIGRSMVDLMLGQAFAFGLKYAEVLPYSYRADGRLEDGRDRARVFWEDLGFKYWAEDERQQRHHRLRLRDSNILPPGHYSLLTIN